jgi:hypothetical protein
MALHKVSGESGGVSFTRTIALGANSTYTVPNGSYAVITSLTTSANTTVTINGVGCVYLSTGNYGGVASLSLNHRLKAGDVISTPASFYALLEEWAL